MSTERSSSAVRNLRTIFESKESEANAIEKRPVSQERSQERRPLSKVRSSFVVVDQGARMAKTSEDTGESMSELTQVSSASLRRESFGENGDNSEQLAALKKSVSRESEKREMEPTIEEAVPEAAIESTPELTPVIESKEEQVMHDEKPASKLGQDVDKADETAMVEESTTEQESLDTSAAVTEDSPAKLDIPVAMVDEQAVLVDTKGVEAANEENAPRETREPSKPIETAQPPVEQRTLKPTNIIPKASKPPANVSKTRLPSTPKSPNTTKPTGQAIPRDLSRKVSRSSLTAPTAASNARAAEKRESLASSTTRSKPRESTKLHSVSSTLLAPTAASRARQEVDTKTDSRSRVPAKTTTTKPATRTSNVHQPRPESNNSQNSRKLGTVDGGFLDRLTKPTAASQHRAQEKYESTRNSPRKSLPVHSKAAANKTNGKPAAFATNEALVEEEGDSVLDLE